MVNSTAQMSARCANDHHDIERIAIELMPNESQIPTASQAASRRFATRLALFYGTLFGLVGTHLPFLTGLAERRQALRGAMRLAAVTTALGFALIGTQREPLAIFLIFTATAC